MTIKEARLDAGLSQGALAKLIGMSKRTVENWEEGTRTPAPWIVDLIVYRLEGYKKEGK